MMMVETSTSYDAILIVSFGGPEGMDDVMPFLENVLRGRNVPRERMLEVAEHYYHFGGVSPINGQNRTLIAALEDDLRAHNIHLPIYWGNRNWQPLLADTMRQMRDDGIKHALAFFTSAYSSYSGCRQYREDSARAQAEVGEGAPQVSLLRKFYNHPGFVGPMIDNVHVAFSQIPAERHEAAHIAFTAHSIPLGMANASNYEAQLQETSRLIAEGLGHDQWQLVYQSRSGSPMQPWLEPDIGDHVRALHEQGVQDVIVVPIGFISDHMEVLFDLDTEAKDIADELGMTLVRAATVGTDPTFIGMSRDLIIERMTDSIDKPALGTRGPSHEVCPVDCCFSGTERPTQPKEEPA